MAHIHSRVLILTAILTSGGLLSACGGGETGPRGADGKDGADGAAGTDGDDGADAAAVGTITGVVVDSNGGTVSDVTIVTSPLSTTIVTSADGAFAFTDIPIGAYELALACDGYASMTVTAAVAGGLTTDIEVELTPDTQSGGAIAGVVVDVEEEPVVGAEVHVDPDPGVVTTTASDGSFTLTGLSEGMFFVEVTAPSDRYLDGGPRQSFSVVAGEVADAGEITLSGRPSASATWKGGDRCYTCHASMHGDYFTGLESSAHSSQITEGTDELVYPDAWPEPYGSGSSFPTHEVPLDPDGDPLLVEDPRDSDGLVNLVLCTDDSSGQREFLFKFYPDGDRTEDELDCADLDSEEFVAIPVAGTVGGQGNWGEGYLDPYHLEDDAWPNFGEGKQRFWAKLQDVPYVADFFADQGIDIDAFGQQDYVLLPVYFIQDGTPEGSALLADDDFGVPKFWQKAPTSWVSPTHTMSRNCAGCHATGMEMEYQDFTVGTTTFSSVVTAFDYIDLNITCERCHGPGSEHASSGDPTLIISPQYLTVKAANETCGQCHVAHSGLSANPAGIFKYAYDATYEGTLGDGIFVPGVYDLSTFVRNYNVSTKADSAGSFDSWDDQVHSRAHAQELAELILSPHYDNDYRRLACFDCHDPHSLKGGPESLEVGDFEFQSPKWSNNELCLACHAGYGPFAEVSTLDVAQVHEGVGGTVLQAGTAPTYVDTDAVVMNRVARAVASHMQAEAGMGGALYTPADEDSPVGACTSCHMPEIGRLKDNDDDAQYHLDLDADGNIAVAAGNVPSHVFDIVWPAQSAVLVPEDRSSGHDYKVMPNSCSACHDFARISGDLD